MLDVFTAVRVMLSTVFTPVPVPEFDDNDSDSEEMIFHVLDVERILRLRGKRQKQLRNDGFVDIVTRLNYPYAQFKAHFRMPVQTFHDLENRIGALIMRQSCNGQGRPTVPSAYTNTWHVMDFGDSRFLQVFLINYLPLTIFTALISV